MSYWKESYMKICRGELYKKAAPPLQYIGEGPIIWSYEPLLISSFFIRYSRVVGFSPRIFAAPF